MPERTLESAYTLKVFIVPHFRAIDQISEQVACTEPLDGTRQFFSGVDNGKSGHRLRPQVL